MHGRRGPDARTYLAPVWSFDTDYGTEERAHFNLPYFSGDVLWGSSYFTNLELPDPNVRIADAGIVQSSIQILDPNNELAQKALAQIRQFGGYGDPISLTELERGDQIPLITSADPSWWNVGIHPDEIDFWAYRYHAVERPGVRVREIVMGSDVQASYWRFDDPYHLQSGNGIEGDLPGDFKFIYGGAVLRDEKTGEGEYAIYGSGWVHTEYDDPLGTRVMPPFQGAAGGPSGGPLFTIFDKPIDMFFVPLAVRPGMVLELGDTFRMAGPIMPTLPSKIKYTVTAPDGSMRSFDGVANAVGYYYQPVDDFILDQTGKWIVELTVTHDGMTSAGPVEEPYPTGGPLTPDLHTFSFFVVESAKDRLPLYTNLSDLEIQPWQYDVDSAAFAMMLPKDLEADKVLMVATIPGIVVASEELSVKDGRVDWTLVGPTLNRQVHNLDYLQGLADTITITFFAEDDDQVIAGNIVVHGSYVPLPPGPSQTPITYPDLTGKTILVINPADDGPGTLRQALLDAQRGDVITFDPEVFPPDAPTTIALSSGLSPLEQGHLTIDSSDAGVILDGSQIKLPEFQHGIVISSDYNIIRGLQIVGFTDAGIALQPGSQHNIIGGDPVIGDRRWGQGNVIIGNHFGVGLWGEDTSHNTIQGNLIGITWNGGEAWGNDGGGIHSNGATQNLITDNAIGGNGAAGIYLCCVGDGGNTVTNNFIGVGLGGRPIGNREAGVLIDRSGRNVVGPGNTIAHNNQDGIAFWEDTPYNTITQNSIYENGGRGIIITNPDNSTPQPHILMFDLQAGTVSGTACGMCIVDVFSDGGDEGAIYEGRAQADENGVFRFEKGASLAGPFLTATTTDPHGSTSEFSAPTQESP
jgi:hypothetical protein